MKEGRLPKRGPRGVGRAEEREGSGLPERKERGNLTRGCGGATFPNEARVRGNPGLAGKFLSISKIKKRVVGS